MTRSRIVKHVIPPPPPPLLVETIRDSRGFTTGTWAGFPNYVCESCTFATTDLSLMLAHQQFVHGR